MKYLAAKDGNFVHMNNVLGPEIVGRVQIVNKRILKWRPDHTVEDDQPCHQEFLIPLGYTLAYDLNVETNGTLYRFTLNQGAIEKALRPYLNSLLAAHVRIEDVVTRICATIGPYGNTLLSFSAVKNSQ